MGHSVTIRSQLPADDAALGSADVMIARHAPADGWLCIEQPCLVLHPDDRVTPSGAAPRYLFIYPKVWVCLDDSRIDPDDVEAVERRAASDVLHLLAGVRAVAVLRRDRFRVGFEDWVGVMSAEGPDAELARWMKLLQAGTFVDEATRGAPFGVPMASWTEAWE